MIVMRSARSPLLKEAGDLSSALTDAAGAAHRPGPRHPDPHGRDGLHRQGIPQARAGGSPARRRRVVPQPARGGRQSPAGRQGGAAGVLRRAAGRLRHQPRALGRYRRRRARQLRAVGDRVLSGRPPHRAHPALLGGRARSARRSTSCWRTCAAATSARATSSPSSPPTTSPAAGSTSCSRTTAPRRSTACFERLHDESEPQMRAALRALPDGVWEGEDWLDDDGVDDRPHPHPRPRREARRRGDASTSRAPIPRRAAPSTPRTTSRARRSTTR